MGFTKLDEGIVLSSIWSESLATRVVWVTMLAMSDSNGLVSCSRSGLMRSANVSQEDFDSAITLLEGPDKDSRSPEHEGRRIEKCDRGWLVLNYKRYREFTYSGSKEAIKKRRQRDKKGTLRDMSPKGGDISASASVLKNTINTITSNKETNTITTDIINYLNIKTNKNYRPNNPKTRELISARIKIDKATLDDFKKVIDVKTADWKGTESDKYLRPETLFGIKFESYRNQKPKQTLEEGGEAWIKWSEEKEAKEKGNDNEEKL